MRSWSRWTCAVGAVSADMAMVGVVVEGKRLREGWVFEEGQNRGRGPQLRRLSTAEGVRCSFPRPRQDEAWTLRQQYCTAFAREWRQRGGYGRSWWPGMEDVLFAGERRRQHQMPNRVHRKSVSGPVHFKRRMFQHLELQVPKATPNHAVKRHSRIWDRTRTPDSHSDPLTIPGLNMLSAL